EPRRVELTGGMEPRRVELADGTTISVAADPVTDARDRSFGQLVRCTDVTDRRRRAEQLTLLSRFVVEVIRERMAAVAEESRRAADQESGDAAAAAAEIWERTTRLTTLVAQTRSIERAIAENEVSPDQGLDPWPVLRELRDSITTGSGPRIALDGPGEPLATTVSPALLAALLEPVLEDAFDRAEKRVDVSVDHDSPAIRIVGDRPAMTDFGEQEPDADLPLAVTRLALDQLGGHLSVERTDDGRRAVLVSLPTNDAREAGQGRVNGGVER
ncbi:MAG: PAS sensor protein, partial [Halorhabdus sp.]